MSEKITKVVTDVTHYNEIAKAIQESAGSATTIPPNEMANGIRAVAALKYGDGFVEGESQGIQLGIKAQYDEFWDAFQNNGKPTDLPYAFYGDHWNDTNYNPKYPLVDSEKTFQLCFYNSNITNIKVPMDLRGCAVTRPFRYSLINTVPEFIFDETTTDENTFNNASKIANIEKVTGTIGQSFNFSVCPLTTQSMKNIINALADYSGTDKDGTCTISFSSTCWTALEADSTAPDGGTWKDYVYYTKGWNY